MGEARVGTEIAGYRIEGVIGRGGMGVVYEARQAFPDRRVALKVLSPELAADPAFRGRFLREASAAASTEHPNIVPVYSAGEAEGTLYLAMRLVEGTDLRRRLAEGPLDPGTAVRIVSQVADALDAAHERGLVHRDVKPGNVLLDRAGRAYLVDFGLVRRVTETTLTQSGQFMGSIDYCAPEQIRGEEPGPVADVYSLGCVLYECLTGSPPFGRGTEVATLYAHLEDPPPRPSATAPEVPEALDTVVVRAMAKRPDERFPTARAMGQACLEAVGGAPPAVRKKGRTALVLGLASAAIAVILAVVLLTRDVERASEETGEAPAPVGPPLNSVVEMDPQTGRAVRVIETGHELVFMVNLAVGEGGIWISGYLPVLHVDPVSGTTRPPIARTRYTVEIAVGFRTAWLARSQIQPVGSGAVVAVNPATDEVIHEVAPTVDPTEAAGGGGHVYGGTTGVAAGETAIWASTDYGSLLRIDPDTGAVTDEIPIGGLAGDVAAGEGAIWVVNELDGEIVRVDPETSKVVARIPYLGNATDIVVGEGSVWVLDPAARTVTPMDPDSNTAGPPIGVGPGPVDLAVGLDGVWVADQTGVVTRINPVTKDVMQLEAGSPVAAVEIDPSSRTLWLLIADRDL